MTLFIRIVNRLMMMIMMMVMMMMMSIEKRMGVVQVDLLPGKKGVAAERS